jgi:hypothetical protein
MIFSDTTLRIIWTISLAFVIGIIGMVLANWFIRMLRVRADKKHTLKLVNKGNTPCNFYLSASSAKPELAFTFLLNDIPLIPVAEEIMEEIKEEAGDSEEMLEEESQVSELESEPVSQPDFDKTKVKKGTDGALKAGKSVASKSGVAAGLLGTLGSILPGSLGASLKEKSNMARNVQMKSAKVTQAPQLASNKMNALKSSGGKLGVNTSKQEDHSPAKNTASYAAAVPTHGQVVIPVQSQKKINNNKQSTEKIDLVQTGTLNPGESLMLTLRIGKTKKRYPVGSFIYEVKSQQVPLDSKFGSPAPISKTGTVYYKPVAAWRYWMPFLGGFLVYLLTLIGILYGINFLWG